MGKRVTNVNNGGTVGIQAGAENTRRDRNTSTKTEVTNVNDGGTVGIQSGGNVSGCTVIIGR